MTATMSMRSLLPMALGACLASCSFLEPREDPTRFVVLAAIDEMSAAPSASPGSPTAARGRIGLGPIVLPEYLQRLEIVTRFGGTQLVPSENDRWGEPLQRGVERVLALDLERALGAQSVVMYPWYAPDRPDAQVEITFSRFELEAPRTVVLRAQWSIRDLSGEAPMVEHDSHITRTATSEGAASAASAMSDALAALCDEIAAAWPR